MTIYSQHNIKVFKTIEALNIEAVNFIIELALNAIKLKGRFVISLSGGQTPEKLYSLLAQYPFRNKIEWEKVFVFWGDERCVPLNNKENNAFRAKTILFNKVKIPAINLHAIPVNLAPHEAAKEYEKEIKNFFGEYPAQFDLVLLGLGENGHTASLFPGTNVINEVTEGIRELYLEEENRYRITMTAPLINKAHTILFIVTGERKASILKTVLNPPYLPDKYPAQLIKSTGGKLFWFIDKDAASFL